MSKEGDFGGSIKEYEVSEELGRGGFAIVYQARCRNTGYNVAIKKIDKSLIHKGHLSARVKEEVTIHAKLNHPSVLRLYTFFEDSDYVYLVLELCLRGELQKLLRSLGRVLTEDEAREYLGQIVQGMLYLQSNSIIHRDMTLSNILIDDLGRLKIADFGLATHFHPNVRHTTMCGTPNFISPEVVTRDPHGLESDVWSLGCMMYVMLVGRAPFDTRGVRENILNKVVTGKYELPDSLSYEARSLIVSCLQKNPKDRIHLSGIPFHPFMTGSKDGEPSDSGVYTISTMATTHHPLTAFSIVTEDKSELSIKDSESQAHVHSEPYLRHPPSPPVRMKSNPRHLLPVQSGIIDNLKRKYTPLPSLRRDNLELPHHALPSFSKRERDVSEERRKQLYHPGEGYPQEKKAHEHQSSISDARYSYSSQSSTSNTPRSGRTGADLQGHSGDTGRFEYTSDDIRDPVMAQRSRSIDRECSDTYSNMQGCTRSGHSKDMRCEGCSDHRSRSFDRGRNQNWYEEVKGEARRGAIGIYREAGDVFGHRQLAYSRDKTEGIPEQHVSRSLSGHSNDRSGHQHRSRSLEINCGGSREMMRERHRAHSCCQGSYCDKRDTRERTDSNLGSRHNDRERHNNSYNGQRYQSSGRHQTSGTEGTRQTILLSDIPRVHRPPSPAGDNGAHPECPQFVAPNTLTKQLAPSTSRPPLSQQVSPISSHRLKKVRYRSKRYLLNILDNGEVCLEQLKTGTSQKRSVVEDACWISPDGLEIIIYQPERGVGYECGDSPPPKPEKEVLCFSYDNLPTKYWRKYKDAARFVKLVKSRTTKITYYSKEAKFYLMENFPDPDFVAIFYQGTKVTKSGNSTVVKESTGASHTVSNNSSTNTLPKHLLPLYEHFKQAQSHCRLLEQVLSETTTTTTTPDFSCFPAVFGRKLPSTSGQATGSMSQAGGGYNKENLSPPSCSSSFRSPRNILSQLGTFDASVMSTQVTSLQGTFPRLPSRTPLSNQSPNSLQPIPASLPVNKSSVVVDIPEIGRAYKESGVVHVDYISGAQMMISSVTGQMKYRSSDREAFVPYTGQQPITPELRRKLTEVPCIIKRLEERDQRVLKHNQNRPLLVHKQEQVYHSSGLR